MEPTSSASIKIARCYLATLVVVSVVRAITQSVTPGEAANYVRFAAPEWAGALGHFDVSNHVLNTLLMRISTTRFHLTELSMRLPSLMAGALYLWAVYRLAIRWFGGGAAFLAMLGLMTLNPMVIDALSEARGYGAALAVWLLAFDLILQATQEFSVRNLNLAAVFLGLSMVASLAFAAPACALLIVAMLWFRSQRDAGGRHPYMPHLMFLTLFVMLTIPVNRAQWATLGIGATNLRQTLNELTSLSLGSSLKVLTGAVRVGVALAALAGIAAALRYWRQRAGAVAAVTGAVFAISLILLLGAHRYLRTPFPQEGGLYLVVLGALLFSALFLKQRSKAAQIVWLAVAGVVLVRYAGLFRFGAYAAGEPYSGGRTVAKMLRKTAGTANVRVGVSQDAEPILSYYRLRYRQANWQPDAKSVDAPFDYYVLTPRDAALIEQRHLHVIYRDTGFALAQ